MSKIKFRQRYGLTVLLAALAMVFAGCVSMKNAYTSINWERRPRKMMSPFRLLLTILICLSYAQVNAEEASDNSLDRFLSEKRELIEEAIVFTEQEEKAFWPLYDDYMNDLVKRYHRRSALVKKILKEKELITEKQAGAMIDEHIELVSERLKSKKEMLAKLRKSKIPEIKILKFLQIEEKMQATFLYLLAANIPMIK